MAASTVSFPSARDSAFTRDVKSRVDAYFAEGGRSANGTKATWIKVAAMLALFLGPYALIMSGLLPLWAMWVACGVMGMGMAGVGFSVGHDALHGALSPNPRVNGFVGLSFELMGVSSTMWKTIHNVVHHTYTNVYGVDIDLEPSPLLRLSPHAPHHFWHRLQHWFALPAYGFLSVLWISITDFVNLGGARIARWRGRSSCRTEWLRLVITKLVYASWAVVLPLWLLPIPWWQVLVGMLTMHMVGSVLLSVVFQLAHVVEETEQPLPQVDNKMEDAWMEHELRTTANFAPTNKVLGWYVGGLNYQIEHHLFPRVCSVHYPALSKLVEATAREHGLTYRVLPTFRAALASHFRLLRTLSRRPATETLCPLEALVSAAPQGAVTAQVG